MYLRKSLVILGISLAVLCPPMTAHSEPPVLAGKLFQVFEYQEDEVPARLRFHLIGKRLFLEQSGMAYWAAEVGLDKPSDLYCAPVGTTVSATVRRFSGFSNAGRFWDDGRKTTITVSSDGVLTLGIDGENPIRAIRSKSDRTIHSAPSLPAPEKSALMDSWTSADGTVAAEFRTDGTMVFMSSKPGSPAEVYFGSYSLSEQHLISYTAVRLGWGGMPHEGTISYTLEAGNLSLRSVDGDPSILGSSNPSVVLSKSSDLPIM